MKKAGIVLAMGSLLVLTALPREARAAACGNFLSIVADGRVNGPVYIDTTGDLRFTFWVVSGRSYSVEVDEFDYADNLTVIIGAINDVCPAADGPGLTESSNRDPIVQSITARRVGFTAAGSGYVVARVGVTAGTHPFTFKVADTTQFSPAWSTNGSFNTFYSIFNTTNGTCSGTLILRNTAGTPVTTAGFSVAAGATGSTNTVSLGTVRDTTGTASLTHNCPPGALLTEAAVANFSTSPAYIQIVKFAPTREAQ